MPNENEMTILEALATITTPEEMDGFTECLRNPPPGIERRLVSDEEWRAIALKKIEMERKEQAHAHRKDRERHPRRR